MNDKAHAANDFSPNPSTGHSLATVGLHADDAINYYDDVAPALHVASTFRYPRDPNRLVPGHELALDDLIPVGGPTKGGAHVYSRLSAPNASRLELMLTSMIGAPVLTYSSGLSAFHALLVHLQPKVVAIGAGYHGCHGVLKIYQRLTGCQIVDLFDEKSWEGDGFVLGKGDVVHLETPVNPTGRAFNLEHYARMAHQRGAVLTVDATFAPPPLLDPWTWGADYVMHSGSKYFGGHSDMLCGVLAIGTKRIDEKEWKKAYQDLFLDRVHLGGVMGSLEAWLGVRSLRTFELRVKRQSDNAERLVRWIDRCLNGARDEEEEEEKTKGEEEKESEKEDTAAMKKVLSKIEHASLQVEDMSWLKKQMPNGFGPVFGVWTKSEQLARKLPSKLDLFQHATSLGGVESLVEWRRMSDESVAPTLLRFSIGVEDSADLKRDLSRAFRELAREVD